MLDRRDFLMGLIGVAAIPYVGFPTFPAPAFEVTGKVTAYFPNPALLEAHRRTQKELVDGIIEQLTSVNPMFEGIESPPISSPYASKDAEVSDTVAAANGYCGPLRDSIRTANRPLGLIHISNRPPVFPIRLS